MPSLPHPRLATTGDNPTLLWNMANEERMRRIARALGLDGDPATGVLLADLTYVVDVAWVRHLSRRPETALLIDGRPMLVHASDLAAATAAMRTLPPGMATIDARDPAGIYDDVLRKREMPFAMPLTPATVAAAERASYRGAYKGVTDALTLYLWPTWAFHLTRLAARIGLPPNGVTAIGTTLCIVATVAFWRGWFWTGLLTGLIFMVLDTVDGKLARCTITSSRLGNAWDHGIDLIHPPIWWWAWSVGCTAYGRPLNDATFWVVIATMLVGYVAQRLIEGAFIVRFGMHIHVWEKFDSDFRLVTARRNPNMVILFAGLIIGRPEWGIIGVAAWTALSLAVHLVRLAQAGAAKRRGEAVVSWLA